MNKLVKELCDILKDEENSYLNLLRIEQKKQDAVLERDGKLLKNLCEEEEGEIQNIETRESKRLKFLENIAREKGVKAPQKISELEKWPDIDDASKKMLIKERQSLFEILSELDSVTNTTAKMLKDSADFFREIINEISAGENLEYEPHKKNQRKHLPQKKNPVFINANC
ncbi:MAG: flagellar protein FlgN [Spirochaetia bacterium]|nr:flagellar protein FlgN [Spirochaetia bacterium]